MTVPGDLLGVDPTSESAPARDRQALTATLPRTDNRAFTSLGTTDSGGTKMVRFDANQDSTGDVLVNAVAPHGIVHAEFEVGGGNALVVDIGDASATAPAVYKTLSQQASALQTAIDPNLDISQGSQTWGTCNAGGCSVNVSFTNSSSVTARVLVTGNWTGDNSPVGNCQVISDPVAASAGGSATCTVNTPQWAAFYHHAQTVPGSHPYELRWAAFALAEAPKQQTIDTEMTEASTPAKPSTPTGDNGTAGGGEYVYRIDYQDAGSRTQVWKYGVTNVGSGRTTPMARRPNAWPSARRPARRHRSGRLPTWCPGEAAAAQLVVTATAATGSTARRGSGPSAPDVDFRRP